MKTFFLKKKTDNAKNIIKKGVNFKNINKTKKFLTLMPNND